MLVRVGELGSNHENKIGLKRGFPSSGGDLRVSKSKPIAKSLPRCHVTRWEFFGVRVPGYRVKFYRLCTRYQWVLVGMSRGFMLAPLPLMLDQAFRNTGVRYRVRGE